MTNEHTSFEKYTSHTLFERVAKGLCVRGELETEQTATYWPQVPPSLAALLSHSAGLLNRGFWGPRPLLGAGSHCNSNSNKLIRTNPFDVHLLPVSVEFPPNSTRPWLYLDIFDQMFLFLDWRLGRRSTCNTRYSTVKPLISEKN